MTIIYQINRKEEDQKLPDQVQKWSDFIEQFKKIKIEYSPIQYKQKTEPKRNKKVSLDQCLTDVKTKDP